MQRTLVLLLSLALASPAFASGDDVKLRASTVQGTKPGSVGRFDTTQPDTLLYRADDQAAIAMPYAHMSEFSSDERDAFHTGFFAAIGIGLFIPRPKVHLISISYTDAAGVAQSSTFQVTKHMPETFLPVLYARARNACVRQEFGSCTPVAGFPDRTRRPLTTDAKP